MPDARSVPDWVATMPEELSYQVVAVDYRHAEPVEMIKIEREEYCLLKTYLAGLRGHVPKTVPVDEREWDLIRQATEMLNRALEGKL